MGGNAAFKQDKMSGALVYNANGAASANTLGNASKNSTDLVLNAAYGFKTGSFLTTVGLEYDTGNVTFRNVGSQAAGVGTSVDTTVKNRIGAYIAPGFMIDASSVAYVKLGYETASITAKGDTGTATTGGLKSGGYSYGLGYKRLFAAKSPWYGLVEYTETMHKNSTLVDSPTGAYANNGDLKTSKLSLGVGYNF